MKEPIKDRCMQRTTYEPQGTRPTCAYYDAVHGRCELNFCIRKNYRNGRKDISGTSSRVGEV